ncbi:MAG: type II toxin-antitoxin system HigB family toxin [Bacteroidota bacterium]
MRIISTKVIKDFYFDHPNAEPTLTEWIREVRQAIWETPNQLRQLYPTASILPGNRAVFRLGGGKYRLIVVIHYNRQIVYIRFIGTHAEYDRIDPLTI